MIALVLAGALAAETGEEPKGSVEIHGDLKSFFTASVPYEHALMPEAPSGQGVFDARLKLDAAWGEGLSFQFHQTATAITGSASQASVTQTGVGLTAPEVVDLSWVATDEDLVFRGRVDRLALKWSLPGVDLTVGRQPISFGHALVFTPLDLVNPFNPAFIDQEYKPGVDALRVDAYAGVSSQLTLAAAYAGSWDREGLVVAAYGQSTIRVTDLGLFVASVRGDAVFGTSVVSSVGPVGVTSDVALTLPADDRDPFVRGTLGVLFRPGANTTVTAEAYLQTLGSTKADGLLGTTADPRFQRGEVWLMGVGYLSVAVVQQITPMITGSVAVVGNVLDPSAFVAPSLGWSVASNVELALGGFVGIGARPDDVELTDLIGPDLQPLPASELTYLNSEFGTYPGVAFAQVRVYF